MKKKTLIYNVFVLVLSMCFYSTSFGECPEGKSEIQLITPSGIQKSICVPDEAIPGIENAAENSEGTIIPSSCPCWNADDISYYETQRVIDFCTYSDGLLECLGPYGKPILEAYKVKYCKNYVTEVELPIVDEEWNACTALVDKLLKQ